MGLPRTAVSVGLDDAKTFTKTLAAVTALVTKGAAQPGMPQLKLGSRKAHAGEQQVFTARLGDSPLEPAWCVDGDRLLIGVSAEAVEAMIAQRAAPRSLADVAEVKALLGDRVATLGYQEPQAAVASLAQAYAAICDDDGKPLLSWRVRMLPYLGEQDLHAQFKLDEPWDSEHNKKLVEKMPKIFASPGDAVAKPGMTRYLVPTGKGTIFPQPDKATRLAVVSDGLLKTILIVEAEAAKAVPWTKPEDLPVNLDKPHEGLKNARPTGFTAAFADGSVRLIPADVAAKVLAAAFTRSGDE
jgi:hypothetical protein